MNENAWQLWSTKEYLILDPILKEDIKRKIKEIPFIHFNVVNLFIGGIKMLKS